jgi:membrane-bound lytic murein transglycosylase D
MAYRQIVLDPQAYGIVLPELENHPYFVAVEVGKDIDVALVIQLSEIPEDEFQSLNPSFNKPVILSNANQQILLPFGHAEIFQANLKKYNKPLSSWAAVQVTKTESVDQCAKTLGVDADTLRAINGIPRGMRIRSGSTVLVPKTSRNPGDISLAMAENGSLSLDKPAPPAPKKCAKGAKCPVPKPEKGRTKGNSSANNAASQHKSASTELAKSAKNVNAKASSPTAKVSNSKGASKIQ